MRHSDYLKGGNNKAIVIGAIVVALLALGGYQYYRVSAQLKNTQTELAAKIQEYDTQVKTLEETVSQKEKENEELGDELEREKDKINDFEKELRKITGTVNDLEKLSKTDPELLQKYSKIFFLNEHYVPPRLATIDAKYVHNAQPNKPMQVHADVWPHLKRLFEEAEEDDVSLKVLSAYRSFGDQTALKAGYTVVYGTGANRFSADQGYSEHQLGTTLDFTTASATPFVGFQNTEAYEWLLENAHRYGFVLSYPEGNAYYQFEPWHWRFVGIDLARELEDDGQYFYDVDQREIDKYLIEIFD